MDGRGRACISRISIHIKRTDDALWGAQKRVRILPRPKREKRDWNQRRERRKDCYQSPLLYDGGARAEGEREEGGGSFLLGGQTDGRTSPVKANKMAS